MPKKAKIEFRMTGYSPFSPHRWQKVKVAEVGSGGRGTVRFVLTPVDNPGQAGRRIHHDLPAVLAPGSPLAEFLGAALGVTLTAGQTVDLASLVGRSLLAKFGEPGSDGDQAILAVKPCTKPAARPKSPPPSPVATPTGGSVAGKTGGTK